MDFLMNFALKEQFFDDPMLAAMVSRVVAMVIKAVATCYGNQGSCSVIQDSCLGDLMSIVCYHML